MRAFQFVITILGFFFLGMQSCKEKPGTVTDQCGVQCQNGGYCALGQCQCPSGFEGSTCEKKSLSRYMGKWNFFSQITGSSNPDVKGDTQSYVCTIRQMPDNVLNFLIDDFAGNQSYDNVRCQIGINDKGGQDIPTNFIFPYMQVIPGSGITIEKGQGSVNELGTTINGSYYTNYILGTSLATDTVYFSGTIIL